MSEQEIIDLAKELNIKLDDVREVILAYENQSNKPEANRRSEKRC
ncbi:hypothetical protein R2F61_07120 [Mollicutes bacterium LVI A0078]|nr:hypothetical protein RZE84_07125 [Mollicutes bacterium LVI A0075]WOO90495.1 hypothetical protein R2F61_07120 [Mollicutes bacterium LVI A0078]